MVDIPILYEDDYLLVVDKSAGVIVHEGAGHPDISGSMYQVSSNYLLTDWIRENRPSIVENFKDENDDIYFRPGIVHRLDKDTSGLLIIAKTPDVKQKLQQLFKGREVTKEYTTLVLGKPEPEQGSIETFIARDPHHRRQMAVSFVGKGKEAKTDYNVDRTWYYPYKGQRLPISLVIVRLHSGRMHQIRVHMKHKGWPVMGDQTYQTKPSRNISKELGLSRQFLHASRLSFHHPTLNELVTISSKPPDHLQLILDRLTTKKGL